MTFLYQSVSFPVLFFPKLSLSHAAARIVPLLFSFFPPLASSRTFCEPDVLAGRDVNPFNHANVLSKFHRGRTSFDTLSPLGKSSISGLQSLRAVLDRT